jgi:DNA-binding MarR family transcriptional regulator
MSNSECKLTPSEKEVLALLSEYGKATWSDLLTFFSREEKSLARALNKLQQKGYIEKVVRSRRQVFYQLTEKGKEALDKLFACEKTATFFLLREAIRQSVLRDLIENGEKFLSEGKEAEAEKEIYSALANIILIPFIYALKESSNEEEFGRQLKESIKISYPILWTAGWVLYQLANEHPEFFEKLSKKLIEKIISNL